MYETDMLQSGKDCRLLNIVEPCFVNFDSKVILLWNEFAQIVFFWLALLAILCYAKNNERRGESAQNKTKI